MGLDIRPLRAADVPAALELSTQAGWNQLAADWHRLLDIAPDGCVAGWVDDELVATGTLVTYDDIGWIGMILVDEDHRRNGYGTAVFERVRDLAEQRGVTAGLDATDAGREVYRQVDFVDVAPIQRWSGELSPPTGTDGGPARDPASAVETFDESDRDVRDAVCALDERCVGVDRSALLDHLLGEDGTTGLAVGAGEDGSAAGEGGRAAGEGGHATGEGGRATGDDVRGYALVRPGREHDHVGPIVAPSRDDAAALLAAAAEVAGERSVLVDLLDVDGSASLLEAAGLECQRRLTRMASREPEPLLVGDGVVAAAGFELG